MSTYIQSSDNMYNKNTELLTKDGWIPIHQIEDQEIAFVSNNCIYYKKPIIIKEAFNGKIINISSTFFDITITENHNLTMLKQNGNWNPIKIKADEIKNTTQLKGKLAFSNTAIFDGVESIGETKVSLLSIIMSIGIVENNKITLIPPYDNIVDFQYIIDILDFLQINHTVNKVENEIFGEKITEYRINILENIDWVYRFLYKNLTPRWNLLHLKENELNTMFTIINYIKSRIEEEEITFVSNDEYMIDWYRTLCLHLGLRTRLFDKINLYTGIATEVSKSNFTVMYANLYKEYFKDIEYSDFVYGVKTKDCIVIKSNNKISINSGY